MARSRFLLPGGYTAFVHFQEVERQLEQVKKALLAGADPAALAPKINALHGEARTLRELLAREEGQKPVVARQIDEGRGGAGWRVPRRRGTPNGIRTRVSALKGQYPRPLDDGGTIRTGPTIRIPRASALPCYHCPASLSTWTPERPPGGLRRRAPYPAPWPATQRHAAASDSRPAWRWPWGKSLRLAPASTPEPEAGRQRVLGTGSLRLRADIRPSVRSSSASPASPSTRQGRNTQKPKPIVTALLFDRLSLECRSFPPPQGPTSAGRAWQRRSSGVVAVFVAEGNEEGFVVQPAPDHEA